MPRINGSFAAALLGLSLGTAALSHAQTVPPSAAMPGADRPSAPSQQGMPGMAHGMPVQGGGMCGPGGTCGMGQPAQGAPMQGMMQGGCPMMQRAASLERRLRQLEERMGIPALPPAPAHPGAPG